MNSSKPRAPDQPAHAEHTIAAFAKHTIAERHPKIVELLIMHHNPEFAAPRELLPEGAYVSTIENAHEATSRAGDPMLVTDHLIHHNGRSFPIRDRIVNKPGIWKKAKFLCDSIGVPFDDPLDLQQLKGKRVAVNVEIDEQPGYAPRNVIRRYRTPSDDHSHSAGFNVPF